MKRRKFVIGLGALASGTAAAMGTGAFSSVSADRSVSVTLSSDANAYLGLAPSSSSENGVYAEGASSGELSLAFDSLADGEGGGESTTGSGAGVNNDSHLVAHDVFRITNQGTQPVEVDLVGDSGSVNAEKWESQNDGTGVFIYFDPNDGKRVDQNTAELDTGESIHVDIELDVASSAPSGTLTIEANAGSEPDSGDDQGTNTNPS